MIGPETLNTLAQGSAERMVDSLVEGCALVAFAWALLRVWPRPNAATRFAVWFSALMATALLPWVSGGAANDPAFSAKSLISIPASWALYIAAAWLVVALISLARVTTGYLQLRKLRRACRAVDLRELDPAVAECLEGAPARRNIQLLTSSDISVPTALGFLHPAVVLPESVLRDLAPQDLCQVLLHEMAHLRRWDDWTNALQQVVKAILFFHPAVWWVEQRLSLEREMACDDAVLAATSSPRAYAECLARLAENRVVRRGVSLAQAAVGRVRQLTARVTSILDAERPTAPAPRKWAVSVVGCFALICGAIAWHAPRLISFSGTSSLAQAARYAPADAVVGREVYAPAIAATYVPQNSRMRVVPAKAAAAPAVTKAVWTNGTPASPAHRKVTHRARRARVLQAKAQAPHAATVVMVYFVEAQDAATGATWRVCLWQWTVVPASQQGKSI